MAETMSVEAVLSAVDESYSKVMQQASDQMQSFEDQNKTTGQVIGGMMQDVGKVMTAAVTVPLAGMAAAAVNTGQEYESSMAYVQAVSGATGDELESLENIARDMGSTTRYSASEAADGLGYMALAGWETEEMVNALPGVLNLATAGQLDLATASDIVTKQNWSVTEKLVA